MVANVTPESLVRALGLSAHPEGGYFKETFRTPEPGNGLPSFTSIYFLLRGDQVSRLHRLSKSLETFYWSSGTGVLVIFELARKSSREGDSVEWACRETRLGQSAGQYQHSILPGTWFGAYLEDDSIARPPEEKEPPRERWALVNCACTPAFEFTEFQMADSSMSFDLKGEQSRHKETLQALLSK